MLYSTSNNHLLQLSPNLNLEDTFTLQSKIGYPLDLFSIDILNDKGIEVVIKLTRLKNKIVLDLSGFAQGTYFIMVRDEQYQLIFTQKLVKL